MKLRRPKHLGWIITGIVLAVLIGFSLVPTPTKVDVHTIARGMLLETIDAEGKTRYVTKYTITLPASGTVSRIILRPGDSVRKGQVIAWYTPPTFDARQHAEASARAEAARLAVEEARHRLESLRPLLEQARVRSERTKKLVESGAIAREQSENAAFSYTQLMSEVSASEDRISLATYEHRAARAAISAAPGQRIEITAPIDGKVLRRFEEQERLLAAGTPIVEIGDNSDVELIVDVLSTDAVRIRNGMDVLIEGWGGTDTLRGAVKTVEPAAHLKVSSLGVEEKRVDVITSIHQPPVTLGDGYKVDVRIIVWEGRNVVTVPLSALVHDDSQWSVFVVKGDQVEKRIVKIGHRATLYAEVLQGLKTGELVVKHPPEELTEGSAITTER
jgi:HlyD family secretion protein